MLSIAIMHAPAPERAASVRRILDATGAPSDCVVTDHRREGAWATARRAWMRADQCARWHVVIQDDAELAPWALGSMVAAAHARPSAAISFYATPRMPVVTAVRSGTQWMWGPDAANTVALLMPTSWVGEMLEWQRHVRADCPHDDHRIGLWLRATGRGCYLTVPQLVGHGGCPSLVGHAWLDGERAPHLATSPPEWRADEPIRIGPLVRARAALVKPDDVSGWPKHARAS